MKALATVEMAELSKVEVMVLRTSMFFYDNKDARMSQFSEMHDRRNSTNL